jgi:protein-disulfide isomerase
MLMPVRPSPSLFGVVASVRAAALIAPAILFLGAPLVIAQSTPPADTPVASKAPEAPGPSAFTPAQRKELESLIKDILLNNPEIMLEVQSALETKMDKIQAERMAVAIKEHAGELYRPASSPIVGNAQGDVPVIEFFDYNCGYCKKALSEVAHLVDTDKKEGKYWEFHRAMLANPGQANEASALRVAEKIGLDMARVRKDMASPEVRKEIEDTRQLATKMGIQGTPHFIVGDRIIAGAPENLTELLDKHVSDVRKEGCKVC